MNLPSQALFLTSFSLLLAGCSLLKPATPAEPEDKDRKASPQLVGRIASIPTDKRFVLIQSYGSWTVETGTILTTRGPDDRSANLRATGESLGQFAAADLQSGLVEVGDAVYTRHVPSPVPAPDPATPTTQPIENQQKTQPQNVQKNN